MTQPPSRWYKRFNRQPRQPSTGDQAVRLICLPYAGGSATFFREWAERLPADIELIAAQYPGRQDLFTEPHIPQLELLVHRLLAELQPCLSGRFALFGHSMGAAIAFELAVELERQGRPTPVRLFLSGVEAPQRARTQQLDQYSDGELVAEIERWSSPGTELYRHPDLGPILIEALRADFALIEAYHRKRQATGMVSVPVTAIVGDADPLCAVPDVLAWNELTTGSFDLQVLPGGHFYLVDQQPNVLELITDTLRGYQPMAAR